MHIFFVMRKYFPGITSVFLTFLNTYAQEITAQERFDFSHTGMGSLFTITCYGTDPDHVKKTAETAFAMIDRFEGIMSDYNPESELMRLSRKSGQGTFIPVSDELFGIIQESLRWSEWSDGIFDITVGAYSQLWRRAGRKDQFPDSSELFKAAAVVGYHNIKLDAGTHSVKLVKPGMQLDLGGIAKGYTVDWIYDLFKKNGYNRILVDGGGDIRVGKSPPGKEGWAIALENYTGSDSIASKTNCAIATSGDLYRYIKIDSIRYSHIIDPQTGFGITTPRTVTVTAPSCLQADVLASILSVSGAEKGFELLENLENVSVMIVEIQNGNEKIYKYPDK
jgi:thiamine biosynthesis lipoprotein